MATTLEELFVKITGDNSSYKRAIKESEDIASKFGKTWDSIDKKLATAVGFAGIGAGALAAAKRFDDASVIITNATGATGDRLRNLETSFANVYKQVDESSTQVAEALSLPSTRTGATGSNLENLTIKLLDLAKVQREDIGTLTPVITRAFGDWSVAADKQAQAADYLGIVSQQTGVKVSRLAEQIVYAGAPLRELGYNFESATALIGKFEKEGVNTELVLGGMKAALQRFTKEGITDTAGEWQRFVAGVKAGTISFKELTEIVGAKRGVDLFKAITEGRFEIEAATKSFKDLSKEGLQTADTIGEKFAKFQHQIETWVAAHKETIITISFAWPAVSTLGGMLANLIKGSALAAGLSTVGSALVIPATIALAAGGLAYGLNELAKKAGDQATKYLGAAYGNAGRFDQNGVPYDTAPVPAPASTGTTGTAPPPASAPWEWDKDRPFMGPTADMMDPFQAMIEAELVSRQEAGIRRLVDAVVDLRLAGTESGKKLAVVWSDIGNDAYFLDEQLRNLPVKEPFDKMKFAIDSVLGPMRELGGGDTLNKIRDNQKAVVQQAYSMGREIGQVVQGTFTNIERSIAHNIVEWGGWKESIVNIGKQFAENMLSTLLEGLLKPLEQQLTGLVNQIGNIWGGGGGKTPGAPSSPGGAASSASGLTGILSTAFSGISAVTGIIGNFQNARQETTLNAIEGNTRMHYIDFLNFYRNSWDWFHQNQTYFVGIQEALYGIWDSVGGAGQPINLSVEKMYLQIDGQDLLTGIQYKAQLKGI